MSVLYRLVAPQEKGKEELFVCNKNLKKYAPLLMSLSPIGNTLLPTPDFAHRLPLIADLVTIGGGLLGATTCYWAARAGVSVILLERIALAFEQLGAMVVSSLFTNQCDPFISDPWTHRREHVRLQYRESLSQHYFFTIFISSTAENRLQRLDTTWPVQQLRAQPAHPPEPV